MKRLLCRLFHRHKWREYWLFDQFRQPYYRGYVCLACGEQGYQVR